MLKKIALFNGVVVSGFILAALAVMPVCAVSNIGPDPADYGGVAGDLFSYTLNRGFGTGNIPLITVPIYFSTPGSHQVTITGGNLCSDAWYTGGNYKDHNSGNYSNGTNITSYVLTGSGGTTSVVTTVDSSNTCKDKTQTLTLNVRAGDFQADIGKYKVMFRASLYAGRSQQNRFQLSVASPGLIGYAAGQGQSFGVAREKANSGSRRYQLPFAPACNYKGGSARITVYDDDNFDQSVQGSKPIEIRIWYQSPTGTTGYVRFTSYSSNMDRANATTLIPHGGNGNLVYANFAAEPGYKYKFVVDSVYWVNVLQFALPFDSINYTATCVGVPPEPPAPTCSGVLSPSILPPNSSTSLRTIVTTSTPLGGPLPRLDLKITGPVARDFNGVTYTQSGTRLTVASTAYTPTIPGDYVLTWRLYGGSLPQDVLCSQNFSVGYQPYFRIVGGDLWAGQPGLSAGVRSWNNDAPNDFYGAGSDLATLATGSIRNFATGRQLLGGASQPTGLSFANTAPVVNVANQIYGGSFGEVPTRTDYYNQMLPVAKSANGPVVDLNVLQSGVYTYTGDISIRGTVQANRHITILTDGTVLLDSTAVGQSAIGYAPYTISTIPSLKVFTKNGDIRVSASLSEIHGFFSVGSGGKFYSCAIPGAIAPNSTAVGYQDAGTRFAQCNRNLKIYGAVAADELIFARTFSSLRTTPSLPAEEIVYSPELWLSNGRTIPDGGNTNLQSYISLPPIL